MLESSHRTGTIASWLRAALAVALLALAGCGGGGEGDLVATEQTYAGTHTGIIPAAFADAIAFAFAR